jgi:rod shape-determining protein MreB
VAIGDEALAMLGRTPDTIDVARPLRDGVIADFVVTEAMLRYFITKICGRFRMFRPELMISVPIGVTSVESRAVHEAAIQAGGRVAHLIPKPLAAALGAGMPINTASGNMIVNIGGGTSETALISLNGLVVSGSVRVGGSKLDEAIAAYLKRKYNLLVGERMAEEVKIQIGSATPMNAELSMEARGRDQVAGLPRMIPITSSEITEAMAEPLASIAAMLKSVLEKTPPELASDVIDRGMVMTGGGSLLRNMDRFLTRETGVPCYVADNPIACVALGAGKALENYELLKRSFPSL